MYKVYFNKIITDPKINDIVKDESTMNLQYILCTSYTIYHIL